ncbi:MAG: polysaccharide biosynthesis C-terminal domain-containing protein [Candidatus Sulfotelmatobacter sp.]
MKFDKRQILRNVGSSWFALGVNVVTGIFLSPYILHRLGDTAFGLWILIFSITGYYGLFDLGIRSSIVRYVAKYSATNEEEELNRLVNTAMFSYSGIGVIAMAITLAAAQYVNSIFHIPAEFVSTARWLLLMAGGAVSLGFPLGVFSGILEGLQRFYLLNFVNVSSTLLRALLIVVALRHGRGLLTVALITVSLPLFNGFVNAAAVFRHLRLRLGPQYVSWSSLRLIAGYSGTTFLIIVAGRLRFKTDALVIATFVSAAAVTHFTIGSRLVDYATEFVHSMAQIFVPMSSQSDALGELKRLQQIFVAGNRMCALAILPVSAILIILGKSVIEAWVGVRYVSASYPVLVMLLIPSTIMLMQAASSRVLFGMGKHQTLAKVTLAEGIANLVLSVLLVRKFGIFGDAVGTAIPLCCTVLIFLPYHLCKLLKLRLGSYLRHAFLLPLLLTIPLVIVLLLLRRWFVPHHLLQLAEQVAIGLAAYSIGILWAVRTRRIWTVEGLSYDERDAEIGAELVETSRQEA